jgi:regulatory protein
MEYPRKYPPIETLERIKKWCDIQERAHSDVRKKLKTWGLYPSEADQVIAELIGSNYLNEERFATAFARGKFRIKGWGWKKIELELKRKGVSAYCIARAKEEIDPDDYISTLESLIRKKSQYIRESDPWVRKQKLLRYAYSRGYQIEDINRALDKLIED